MTTSINMEKNRNHMTERIFDLTMEIIYLLTGEDYKVVRKISGEPFALNSRPQGTSPVMVPSGHSPTHEISSDQKILQVTQKMTDLLTGEVPIRCQDVSVYFSMEEWEYLGGHRDLYKDFVMENEPPLTSPDGSSKRNPPERCLRPLYSRDPTKEDLTIPHHDQSGIFGENVVAVKEEIKKEDEEYGVMTEPSEGHPESGNLMKNNIVKEECKEEDEEYGVMEISEAHKELYQDVMMEPPNRKPPERCPRPLYSRDPIPHHDQGEDLTDIKVEVKAEEEETYVRDDQSTEEAGMMRTSIEEDTPTEISTDWKVDEYITQYGPGEDHNVHQVPHSVEGPSYSSYPEEPQTGRGGAVLPTVKRFSCPECGKSFRFKSSIRVHLNNTCYRPYSCPECGKCFPQKSQLVRHQRTHTGGKPFSCPECGKCYLRKSDLVIHQRSHTGEKPYSCPECGQCFVRKPLLDAHRRCHTGEQPFTCPVCGKFFSRKSHLAEHQTGHTGEKPYSCLECDKSYLRKSDLIVHQRSHTGEKPYSCPECGKGFVRKPHLDAHRRCHTGEKPYCCLVCGKCFSQKSHLNTHQKSLKSCLAKDQRTHTTL